MQVWTTGHPARVGDTGNSMVIFWKVAIMQKRKKHIVVCLLWDPHGFCCCCCCFFRFFSFLLGVVDFVVRFSFDPLKTEKHINRKSTSPPFFKLEPKEEKRCLLLDFCSIDTTGNTTLSGRWAFERNYKFVVFEVSWKSLLLRIPRIFRSTMKLPRHKGWTLQPSTA